MTLMRTETAIRSELLCDLPDLAPDRKQAMGAALVRALRLLSPDPDFAATEAADFTESLDDWADRVLGGA